MVVFVGHAAYQRFTGGLIPEFLAGDAAMAFSDD
jgi:hypothetical protein